MRLNDLDYDLPEELIAQEPTADRADARMLVLNRRTGEIDHSRFYKLTRHLRDGDLLVLNDTRVFPARLTTRKESGGVVELLLVRPALDVLAGFDAAALPSPFITAEMDFGYHGKALPLVAFRPVRYAAAGTRTPQFKAGLQEIPYRGSADVAAAAAADAWLMIPPGITELAAGSQVTVLATAVTA